MRLIDVDDFDNKLEKVMLRYQAKGRKQVAEDYNFVRTVLTTAPTVDAVPVVHGRWNKTQEPLGWRDVDCIECSNCHEIWLIDEDYGFDDLEFWKYCPNCGAKMDGGNENE